MLTVALAVGIAAAAPVWTLDLGESALPFASDAGVLLVATETEVLGVDTADGTVRWRRPQPESVRGDLFQPVPFTPYVLLSTYAQGPDAFEIVDAGTGATAWTAPAGEVVLGAWPDASGVIVLLDRAEEHGHFALIRVNLPEGTVAWRVDDPLRAPPPVVPARPGRTAAVTARTAPGPVLLEDGVVTAWSPLDGIARRGADGSVAWRLVVPGAEEVLPADGYADLAVDGGVLYAPVRPNRVLAVDVATGAVRWARMVRGTVEDILPDGNLVLITGGSVEARDLDGRKVWRADVAAAGAVAWGGGFAVLDPDGVVHDFAPDGVERWAVAVAEETVAKGIQVVGDTVVVRTAVGAVALDATGAVRWRVEGVGAVPEPGIWATGDRARELFREPAPADHPTTTEWVWPLVERVDGRDQVVLHRTDLRTGADASVPLGSLHPRWIWDPRTGTAIVLSAGGHLEGLRLSPP